MRIQRIGTNCVLIIAEKYELGGDLENGAYEILHRQGISIKGRPCFDAYMAGEDMLLFAKISDTSVYYQFDDPEDLIDAARCMHDTEKAADAALYRTAQGRYIAAFESKQPIIEEFARRLGSAPEDEMRCLRSDAWERLGR